MIMRFMDVDPADVLGSAALPSRLGSEERVRFDSSIDGLGSHGEVGSTPLAKDGKSDSQKRVRTTARLTLISS